jgi:hypothetical protein
LVLYQNVNDKIVVLIQKLLSHQPHDKLQVLTQNMHSAPITQQAEKLSFARAERK